MDCLVDLLYRAVEKDKAFTAAGAAPEEVYDDGGVNCSLPLLFALFYSHARTCIYAANIGGICVVFIVAARAPV